MALTKEIFESAFPDLPIPTPTMLSYGTYFTESCTKHVTETFHKSAAYIIASTSLSKQTPYLNQLEAALGDNHAGTWIGIRPHTFWDDLVPIINDIRAKKADIIITLGGSSIADGAKAITYALANNVQSVEDMRAIVEPTPDDIARQDKFLKRDDIGNAPTVPLIFIPTSLSGGEYSKFSGGTNAITHQKDQLTHPGMFASLVILDPQLTVTTPFGVWIQSGVRAIDHCCEAMCSTNAQPAIDSSSEKGLRLLLPGLLNTAKDPQNLEARLNTQLGARLAMAALNSTPAVMKGASHGIGHQLGPLGVGHGHTSCIMLPAVMKWNASRASEAQNDILGQQEILKKVLLMEESVTSVLQEANINVQKCDVGDILRAVFNKLGMPATLKEVGVGRDKFDTLATNSLNDAFLPTNPVPLLEKDADKVLEILELVAGDA
jgi:alcohol dehydrogenase class IV